MKYDKTTTYIVKKLIKLKNKYRYKRKDEISEVITGDELLQNLEALLPLWGGGDWEFMRNWVLNMRKRTE